MSIINPSFLIQSVPTRINESPPLVSLDLSSISLALLVIGIYVCVVGQISYWLKERLYISSALISVLVGIGVGPIGAGIIDPLNWVGGDIVGRSECYFRIRLQYRNARTEELSNSRLFLVTDLWRIDQVTYEFMRLVIGIQVMFAGISVRSIHCHSLTTF